MTVQDRIGMPMDEFIRQYDEAPFELVDDERIPLLPQVAGQAEILRLLSAYLFAYEQESGSFYSFFHAPFVKKSDQDQVIESRTPKFFGVSAWRWIEYKRSKPGWRTQPFLMTPDLCVEVLPYDFVINIEDKVSGDLRDGVRFVWVLNPRQKSVTVRTAAAITLLNVEDMLDGGDLLPGFAAPCGRCSPTNRP